MTTLPAIPSRPMTPAAAASAFSACATVALARTSDPETSHAAARSVADLRPKQRAVYAALGLIGDSATDEQLVERYGAIRSAGTLDLPEQSESGIRTRRAELVRAGLVRDSGRRAQLKSGRSAIRWVVA